MDGQSETVLRLQRRIEVLERELAHNNQAKEALMRQVRVQESRLKAADEALVDNARLRAEVEDLRRATRSQPTDSALKKRQPPLPPPVPKGNIPELPAELLKASEDAGETPLPGYGAPLVPSSASTPLTRNAGGDKSRLAATREKFEAMEEEEERSRHIARTSLKMHEAAARETAMCEEDEVDALVAQVHEDVRLTDRTDRLEDEEDAALMARLERLTGKKR